MSQTAPNYRWSVSEFVRAWDAGAFDHRVELIEGELWPVVIGDWHGEMVTRLVRALPEVGAVLTTWTLPSAGSLPDPDCPMLTGIARARTWTRDGLTRAGTVCRRDP